jgi:hypothetical protein
MLQIPTQNIYKKLHLKQFGSVWNLHCSPQNDGFLSIGNINISIMQEDISLVEAKSYHHYIKNFNMLLRQKESHTSNSSNGLPRRYTSLFLRLSLGRMLYNIALHPISKTAVLPIVTIIKLYGGKWPAVTALIIIPS